MPLDNDTFISALLKQPQEEANWLVYSADPSRSLMQAEGHVAQLCLSWVAPNDRHGPEVGRKKFPFPVRKGPCFRRYIGSIFIETGYSSHWLATPNRRSQYLSVGPYPGRSSMPRRRLIIEPGDAGQLLLHLDKGTLTLRGNGKQPEALLQFLRVARLHGELEVEGESVAVRGPGQGAPRPLQPGEVLQAGGCRLRLEADEEPPAPPVEEDDGLLSPVEEYEEPASENVSTSAPSEKGLPKRLVVIDGADQGKSFRLPLAGTITLGKSRKYADIILHDLYVGRLHCQFEVNGDEVVVVHEGGPGGTVINGWQVDRQAMRLGEVVRVGNSHLRLDLVTDRAGDEVSEDAPGLQEGAEEEAFEVVEEEAPAEAEAPVEEEAELQDIPESVRQLLRLRDELERLSGQVLGHFRIGPVLGRGRHGIVFRAENLKTSQPVALKVLSPLFPQTEAELRHFAQTVKSVLPVRHANVVGIHGVGKTGMYTWIVRDYVEGESVADFLRRPPAGQRPDWRIAFRVAVHVARALDFVRGHHLHHGQVTPANILLPRGGQAALLADLMLASALEGSRLTHARLGYRPASELSFLSPEQVQTEDLVDDAADLYTLGAVIYTLLTGRPPFLGDTPYEILQQVLGPTQAARPSKLQSGIPAALEKMVLRMLAKNPADRYPNSADLLADLKYVAEKEQVEV
jgi:hypothetical protein